MAGKQRIFASFRYPGLGAGERGVACLLGGGRSGRSGSNPAAIGGGLGGRPGGKGAIDPAVVPAPQGEQHSGAGKAPQQRPWQAAEQGEQRCQQGHKRCSGSPASVPPDAEKSAPMKRADTWRSATVMLSPVSTRPIKPSVA